MNSNNSLNQGDLVRVWSLQSFYNGGFLRGELAIVRQYSRSGDSVLLLVKRNFNGVYKISNNSYEVYKEQVRRVKNEENFTIEEKNLVKELRKKLNEFIKNTECTDER